MASDEQTRHRSNGSSTLTGAEPDAVDHPTMAAWLTERVGSRGSAPALAVHDGDGWSPISAETLVEGVRSLAAGLAASGLRARDRVVVMGPTSAAWTRLDLAVMVAGGIMVPLYEASSERQCRSVLGQVGARFAFVADDDAAERLRRLGEEVEVFTLDDDTLDMVAQRGGPAHLDDIDSREITPDSVATIVFTSGTTGEPKGVPLTHHQLVWTARQTAKQLEEALGPDQSTLLFLPLAHIFARVVLLAALEAEVEVAYGRSIEDVPEDLRTYQPTFLLAVPRMLERVISGARSQATGWKRPVFDWAMRTARQWSETDDRGVLLRVRHRVADRLVLSTLREGLGGRVQFAVSGGARLDPKLGHTISGAGITVLEGYGLTETTAPASVNQPSAPRIGTVGPPIPGVTVRISEDGEILVRGPSVTSGHLADDPTSTERLARPDDDFDGEWFRTGDRGHITDDGHLVVGGRIKDIIVTDGGKNVAPVPLEDALTEHPAISQAIVIGDGRPFIGALVVLDDDAPDDAQDQRRLVQEAVDSTNETVSEELPIGEFRIVDRPFTEEDGELTPTMKLRREQIVEHFSDDVEALYAGSDR